MNYNKIIVAGHLGADPESKVTPNGKNVCSFNLAVGFGSGDYKGTAWIPVTCWGKLAETCSQYLGKGSNVLVEGHIRQDNWETGQGKRSRLVVWAEQVRFLTRQERQQEQKEEEDDFPF